MPELAMKQKKWGKITSLRPWLYPQDKSWLEEKHLLELWESCRKV